jgi:hypothetical protein
VATLAVATSAAAATSKRAALLFATLLLVLAAPARAQSLDEVAQTLRSEHVYVDPSANLDAAALKAKIGSAPTFVAVLPASAQQSSAGRTLVALREATGVKGTYALQVGDEFRTLSDEFGDAAQIGDALRSQHPGDLQATLSAYIDRAAKERSSSGGIGTGAIVAVLVLVALLVGAFAMASGRRRTRARNDGRSTVGEIDPMDDFERLGDQIRALELDVTLGDAGRRDYDRAVAAYTRANELQRRGDETGANRALDEGLAAIATARERIAGR